MKLRVGIARALSIEPKIMLMTSRSPRSTRYLLLFPLGCSAG